MVKRSGIFIIILLTAWVIYRLLASTGSSGYQGRAPAAVEAAPIEQGEISDRRRFSGQIEARYRYDIAADVDGRIQKMHVDIGDAIAPGQLIAEIDNREETQDVAVANADLGVAQAAVNDATAALEISRREMLRLEGLSSAGVVSESELDSAKAEYLGKETAVKVTEARLKRASASLNQAGIRNRYANVTAPARPGRSSAPDRNEVVAIRHVNEGDRVSLGQPLLTIVQPSPLDAVFSVTERDYAALAAGQSATVRSDAYPGETFAATVTRIAPAFSTESRQARVEAEVLDPSGKLKDGMFVALEVAVETIDRAILLPAAALTHRDGEDGVFVVSDDGKTARWQPISPGIRTETHVESRSEVAGRVVTLGQQLITDGSPITVIPSASDEPLRVQPQTGQSTPAATKPSAAQ